MKNKRTFLFAGILVAFLMLAVPFAIVSFESENSYATGESEVSGGEEQNTKPSYTLSDDGYALVDTYMELTEALDEKEAMIRLEDNIVITESIIIRYSMILDGNGMSICTTEDMTSSKENPWKLLSIQELGGSVTINNIVLETGGNYSRTLDISNCGKNATVYLNDCQIINNTHYPLFIGSDSVNVEIEGSGEEGK
ncbi:MAG: hypothetical protein E7Z66_05705, partial [Thermoplasmata archaeon]|nr:hypothetical protein [Thermoplasmata archaeon]